MENTVFSDILKEDLLKDLMDNIESQEMEDVNITEEDIIDKKAILNLDQAYFYIKQLKTIREQITTTEELGKAEIEKFTFKISNWVRSQTSSLKFLEDTYSELLRDYASRNSNGKTIKTPYGNLCFRKQPDKYEYDEESIIEFLKSSEEFKDYLNYQEPKIDKSALKKNLEVNYAEKTVYINNIQIPGITVAKQEPKFEVK